MDTTLNWIVGVGVAVLLVVQVAVFIGLYFLARRLVVMAERAGELQTKAEYLLNNTEPVVKLAGSLMNELRQAGDYFAQGMQHFTAIAEIAKDEATDIRVMLGDTRASARREIERVQNRVEEVQDTLAVASDQFARTTAMVQHSVLEPAREFSYVMFGLRRAIETMVAGKRLPVDRAYQDEEMFI